jgi:hypothetical protein
VTLKRLLRILQEMLSISLLLLFEESWQRMSFYQVCVCCEFDRTTGLFGFDVLEIEVFFREVCGVSWIP